MLGFQLRHVAEVHAVPARDQGQRHKDRGHDREDRHDVVLPKLKVLLIKISDLHRVVPKRGRGAVQPVHPAQEQPEIPEILLIKEAVFVFLQFLGKVNELVVMDEELTHIRADGIGPGHQARSTGLV